MTAGFFFFYNIFCSKKISLNLLNTGPLLKHLNVVLSFYRLTDLIWQEGLLIDFLQKKLIDSWVRRFLIHSAYLFNERALFDRFVRFYLDLIIWPLHTISIFEFNNVANTLFAILFTFIVTTSTLFLFYLVIGSL